MQETKLSKLRRLANAKPEDPFPRYGIAMELKRLERSEEAIQAFRELVETAPEYTPAYYHLGVTLITTGREEEAAGVLSRGIEVADSKGETHAAEELRAALEGLV